MRIIPDDVIPIFFDNNGSVLGKDYGYAYKLSDTIPITSEWDAQQLKSLAEITKSEWDEIWNGFFRFCTGTTRPQTLAFVPFGKFVSNLLSLVPLKGLTIEQIKELAK